MRTFPSDVAFTPAVKAVQQARGSRQSYARMEKGRGWRTTVTRDLANFLADLDMFYLGTANAQGQPYIQYRGGPPGFLKAVDERTLGFADFGGNQQYVTLGNLSENPKAFLFLMDYANSRRIKVWGTARGRGGRGPARKTPRPVVSRRGGAGHPLRHRGVGRELPPAHPPAVLGAAGRPRGRRPAGADRRTGGRGRATSARE